ncbi:NAD(P)-binding protein [Mycena amicta]|nr:NAD(P)-binding protein [Mycena amicta]
MAGDIVALGEDVKGWKIGDRVSANFFLDRLNDEYSQDIMYSSMGAPTSGVLREYRTFPAHALVEIPAHLSYEEVSAFPCAGVTAYNALFGGTKSLKAGDTVLIQGTGGVSIFALQFAVASGATTIVTSSSDAKLQIATKLGAKHVINYTTHPNWDEEVLRLTGGTGVDRVVEVGGNATLAKSLAAVRTGGNIDLIGQLGGIDDVSAVDIVTSTIWKEVNIRGMSIGSIAQFKQLIRLLIANPETTRPIIDRVFAFEEARQALEYLEGQKHVGKVIVRVG